MKNLNITTGTWEFATYHKGGSDSLAEEICITAWNKDHTKGITVYESKVYDQDDLPRMKADAQLMCDAANVAQEYRSTPSMLIAERQVLLNNAKDTHEEMVKIINSDLSLAQLVSQHKIFSQYLQEAKAKLTVHNLDPLSEKLDEKSPDFEFIKLLDNLETNP